ncbi:Protein ssh4 [Microbotryomycetes sp. JL221]|nr:Protein ssh4 [Microbotryomycetes sp. JL221]
MAPTPTSARIWQDPLASILKDANNLGVVWPGWQSEEQVEWREAPATPQPRSSDQNMAILLPLLILLSTVLFIVLVFLLFLLLVRRSRRGGAIALGDSIGPTNLTREDELEGEGGLAGVEQRWIESIDEATRAGHLRSKLWQQQYPPNSQPTDITLSQFLSIQEKGVSAWSFDPDYESNPPLFVESRTELTFLADGVGMAPEEGGGCCAQSNLPIPKVNEVYYWECKLFEKPDATTVAIGLATKPYPSFRLPGWNKYSVGYFSNDGFKCHSYPFTAQSYGQPLLEGDVLGVGYRPRSGTVFFTRNGKKLEDAYVGLNRHNLFPTVGADSSCKIHVNFGQSGFVFIEANVKKWGLAPMIGTLAPPPAYGSEGGSILLQSAATNGSSSGSAPVSNADSPRQARRSRHRLAQSQTTNPVFNGLSTQPIRSSPLRSAATARMSESSAPHTGLDAEEDELHNPPTPGLLDISMHSMHRFPARDSSPSDDETGVDSTSALDGGADSGDESSVSDGSFVDTREHGPGSDPILRSVPDQRAPPAYHPIDPNMYAPGVAEAVLEDAFRLQPGINPLASHAAAYEAAQTPSEGSRRHARLFSSWFGVGSSQ